MSLSNNNIKTAEYRQNIRISAVIIWGCRGWGGLVRGAGLVCLLVSRCQERCTMASLYALLQYHKFFHLSNEEREREREIYLSSNNCNPSVFILGKKIKIFAQPPPPPVCFLLVCFCRFHVVRLS